MLEYPIVASFGPSALVEKYITMIGHPTEKYFNNNPVGGNIEVRALIIHCQKSPLWRFCDKLTLPSPHTPDTLYEKAGMNFFGVGKRV